MKSLLVLAVFSLANAHLSFAMGKHRHDRPVQPPAPAPVTPVQPEAPVSSAYLELQRSFDAAGLMTLADLPSAESPLSAWNCVGARADTYAPKGAKLPVRMTATVTTVPAVPAVPAQGPLFPGSPEQPARTQQVALVLFVDPQNPGDALATSNDDLGKVLQHIQLLETPDLLETLDVLCLETQVVGHLSTTYRKKDGMIFTHQDYSGSNETNECRGTAPFDFYGYCWK